MWNNSRETRCCLFPPRVSQAQSWRILAKTRGSSAQFSRFSGVFVLRKFACLSSVTSVVTNSATPWSVTDQAPLSMGLSRQEYWSGLPCPPPGDLPTPWIESASLMSSALAGRFFSTKATLEAHWEGLGILNYLFAKVPWNKNIFFYFHCNWTF